LHLTGALQPLVIMQPATFAIRPPAARAGAYRHSDRARRIERCFRQGGARAQDQLPDLQDADPDGSGRGDGEAARHHARRAGLPRGSWKFNSSTTGRAASGFGRQRKSESGRRGLGGRRGRMAAAFRRPRNHHVSRVRAWERKLLTPSAHCHASPGDQANPAGAENKRAVVQAMLTQILAFCFRDGHSLPIIV